MDRITTCDKLCDLLNLERSCAVEQACAMGDALAKLPPAQVYAVLLLGVAGRLPLAENEPEGTEEEDDAWAESVAEDDDEDWEDKEPTDEELKDLEDEDFLDDDDDLDDEDLADLLDEASKDDEGLEDVVRGDEDADPDWRTVSIDALLGVSSATKTMLCEAGLNTAGDVALVQDLSALIKGIGPSRTAKIMAAVEKLRTA